MWCTAPARLIIVRGWPQRTNTNRWELFLGVESAANRAKAGSDAQPSPGQCNLGCNLHPDSAAFTRTGLKDITFRVWNAGPVKTAKKLLLLDEQITAARNGEPQDFNAWKAKTGVVLRNTVGESDPLVAQFNKISYSLRVSSNRTTPAEFNEARRRGVRRGIALLEAAKTQLEISDDLGSAVSDSDENPLRR